MSDLSDRNFDRACDMIDRLVIEREKFLRERGRLAKALKELCDEIGDTEMHGDGAFDQDCSVCKAHKRARRLLKSLAVPSDQQGTE